jgi:hypothetical protein
MTAEWMTTTTTASMLMRIDGGCGTTEIRKVHLEDTTVRLVPQSGGSKGIKTGTRKVHLEDNTMYIVSSDLVNTTMTASAVDAVCLVPQSGGSKGNNI